ncbi:unnamed protein product [Moneuplotes crassus]|uniref:Uncharacterized protein n=1 Tax=Euplotes crassus TaxID=5936 RepID=A0AAD1ULT4_EUPCR|nr:unnamed protein product [Moneuplotes crassus]
MQKIFNIQPPKIGQGVSFVEVVSPSPKVKKKTDCEDEKAQFLDACNTQSYPFHKSVTNCTASTEIPASCQKCADESPNSYYSQNIFLTKGAQCIKDTTFGDHSSILVNKPMVSTFTTKSSLNTGRKRTKKQSSISTFSLQCSSRCSLNLTKVDNKDLSETISNREEEFVKKNKPILAPCKSALTFNEESRTDSYDIDWPKKSQILKKWPKKFKRYILQRPVDYKYIKKHKEIKTKIVRSGLASPRGCYSRKKVCPTPEKRLIEDKITQSAQIPKKTVEKKMLESSYISDIELQGQKWLHFNRRRSTPSSLVPEAKKHDLAYCSSCKILNPIQKPGGIHLDTFVYKQFIEYNTKIKTLEEKMNDMRLENTELHKTVNSLLINHLAS